MQVNLYVSLPYWLLYRDKTGHVKLSDFGLSTGFHKQHDSSYYQKLLESTNNEATSPTTAAQTARNSVMVNSINLTMTNKDLIATWKANRRKLVSRVTPVNLGRLKIFGGIFYCRHSYVSIIGFRGCSYKHRSRLYRAWDFSAKRL